MSNELVEFNNPECARFTYIECKIKCLTSGVLNCTKKWLLICESVRQLVIVSLGSQNLGKN